MTEYEGRLAVGQFSSDTDSSSFNVQTSDFWHQLLGKVGISQMAGDGASITEC
jgi:hypothetical protein